MQHDTVGNEHWYAHETESGADGHHERNDVEFAGYTRYIYDDTNAECFVKNAIIDSVVFKFVSKPFKKTTKIVI